MSRILYNEGRVKGLDAYEAYVKNALEEDPNTQPVSEREWLASMLAMGSSMLLKIDPFDASKLTDPNNMVFDYKLPSESSLVAPSTITASFFAANPNDFEGIYDDTGWVTQVGSYGDLLKVTSTEPRKGGVYSYNDNSMDDDEKKRMLNYMRIQDGLVLQDGTWETRTASNNPKRILKQPNFTDSPTVRIRFAYEVTESFFVLLTGFITFGVVRGETGVNGGAADTANPYNGDFLGPAIFPWANKIMFHTSSAMAYQSQTSLQAGSGNVEIETNPDSFDTYIKVRNKIVSLSEPYLIVEQDDPDYAGYTEITLDLSSLTDWLADILEAGTGITITESGEGDNKKITIGTNIRGGVGITTSTDDGALVITNSSVGGTFNTIVSANPYDESKYQNYTSFANGQWGSNPGTGVNVWVMWYNGFYSLLDNGQGTSALYRTSECPAGQRGTMTVSFQPTSYLNQNGQEIVTAARIRLSSGTYKPYICGELSNNTSDYPFYGFQLAHTYSVDMSDSGGTNENVEGNGSRVLAIVFPSGSDFSYLSSTSTSWVSATSTPGVWTIKRWLNNDYQSFGGSWNVSTGITHKIITVGGTSYRAYLLYAINIADGYNGQYTEPHYSQYAPIFSGSLDINVEFTINTGL